MGHMECWKMVGNNGDVDADKYPLCMEVLHGLGDGIEHSAGLPLREELLSEDFIQQLPSFKQLSHQENRAAIVIHLHNTDRFHHRDQDSDISLILRT